MGIIEEAKECALNGIPLTKDKIIKLLQIPLNSEEDKLLRKTAYDVAIKKCDGKGCKIYCIKNNRIL